MSDAAGESGAALPTNNAPTRTSPPPTTITRPKDESNAAYASLSPSNAIISTPPSDSDDEENEYNPTAGQPTHCLRTAKQPSNALQLATENSRLLCCLCTDDDETADTVVGGKAVTPNPPPIASSTASTSASSSPTATTTARSRSKYAPPGFQPQDFETRRSARSHTAISYKEKVTTQ